jgi:MYXO-CTERM domain-containing protein
MVLAADGGDNSLDGGLGIDSGAVDSSASLDVALDTAVVADASVAIDTFVAIDLAAAVDGGAKAGDGGAGDGGSGPPPVYLPDGGALGLVADDSGCSFGGGRPDRGVALIPLFGLVALWIVRRRGRR